MGDSRAVSKCPSDPRSGLTCIVRLSESTFALRAVNEQTFANLRTTEHASENVKVARHLRRRRSSEFLAAEKRKMDNTIWQTHTAVYSLAKLLEPARVDRVDMYGDEKISLSTKGLWVLNDTPDIAAAFEQVQVAHEALDEVIGSLQSPRKPGRVSPIQPIALSISSTETNSRPVPYNASQLLAWRRQSRMNLRRDGAIPLKTEEFGVQGASGAEFAIIPPDSHNVRSTAANATAAQSRPAVSLQSQQHDQLQDQDEPSRRNYLPSLPEAQPHVPPKSSSRVSLRTEYPSPPESDTGSSPRPQHYAASTPSQNQYSSPPQSSHGNSPQSQHQIYPQSQSSAPLQDQYQTSLQIEYQNTLRDQHQPLVGNQNNNASLKQFEVISEIEYKPRLPRGYVPRQNLNETPPERQYHIPKSFLARTRSKYRDNATPAELQYEASLQDLHNQSTTQAQQHQTSPPNQQHQQYPVSPRLRFQDQPQQHQPASQSPQVQLPYHNPGPFFLGDRERSQYTRNASAPVLLASQPHTLSRRGYRLPMVFEENLYGGLEVVRPDHPTAISSTSQPYTQPQDHNKGLEVAVDPELESVSGHSQSQLDAISTSSWMQHQHAVTHSQSQYDLGNPYSQSHHDLGDSYLQNHQEPIGTHMKSHHGLGNDSNPYTRTEQEPSSQSSSQNRPGITHTQSLNEANNPYSRSNKRKSWLAWQASRSVAARGLNDRYSL